MSLFALEHSRAVHLADFVFYGVAVVVLAIVVGAAGHRADGLSLAALMVAGLASWSLVEYLLHRFVLHRIPPFSTLHAEHHRRPDALIATPTVFSAGLIVALVLVPALLLADAAHACAFTLGVLSGYLAYSMVHHGVHHWGGGGRWWRARRRAHALHHRAYRAPVQTPGNFGVTSGIWDRWLGTDSAAMPSSGPALPPNLS